MEDLYTRRRDLSCLERSEVLASQRHLVGLAVQQRGGVAARQSHIVGRRRKSAPHWIDDDIRGGPQSVQQSTVTAAAAAAADIPQDDML